MNTPNLTFNLLTFSHPNEKLSFWFTNEVNEELCRIHNTLVPDEVRAKFGEHEHFYTSFDEEQEGFFAVTKNTTPDFEYLTNDDNQRIIVTHEDF